MRLGAPLVNSRWSWGAVRTMDGKVFLRVWQDQTRRIEGVRYVEVANHEHVSGGKEKNGYDERLRHIEAIRGGSQSVLVMCRVKDPKASPRSIQSVDDRDVFIGGQIVELDGRTWLELAERKAISAFLVQVRDD